MNARLAELGDIPSVVALAQDASVKGVCPLVSMDPETISETAEWVIEHGALFVTDVQEGLGSACAVLLMPYHFNKHVTYGYGMFLWSKVPGAGHSVVSAAEHWAKSRGAKKLLLTTNDTLGASSRGRSYFTRRGYLAEETNFVRTL